MDVRRLCAQRSGLRSVKPMADLTRVTVTMYPEDMRMVEWLAERNGTTKAKAMTDAVKLLHKSLSAYGKSVDKKRSRI